MIFHTGMHVVYAGQWWDVYAFETDGDGYLNIVLIDPLYDVQSGKPEPLVYVRDLSGITFAKVA